MAKTRGDELAGMMIRDFRWAALDGRPKSSAQNISRSFPVSVVVSFEDEARSEDLLYFPTLRHGEDLHVNVIRPTLPVADDAFKLSIIFWRGDGTTVGSRWLSSHERNCKLLIQEWRCGLIL